MRIKYWLNKLNCVQYIHKNKNLGKVTKEGDLCIMIKVKKEKNARKNNGITLIALVVTIIVLIILASISIAALTGDNGLINQANDAKGSTEYQQWDERIDVAIVNAEGKHRNPTLDDVIQQLIDSDIISEESQVNRETGDITNICHRRKIRRIYSFWTRYGSK